MCTLPTGSLEGPVVGTEWFDRANPLRRYHPTGRGCAVGTVAITLGVGIGQTKTRLGYAGRLPHLLQKKHFAKKRHWGSEGWPGPWQGSLPMGLIRLG